MATTPRPTVALERKPVVIVGAGPVGLTIGLDLAQRGHAVTVLNRLEGITAGSKAICFAKRTLEIWDRLGIAAPMLAKGVAWETGKVFWGDRPEPIYQFDLKPVKDQKMPAFINLQQYWVEATLVDALAAYPNVELRWGHEVLAIEHAADGTSLTVGTANGEYAIEADWLVACDGSRSTVRAALGLDFVGEVFEDQFLIADIRLKSDRPAERWFWFDPPFNRGGSALLHKQPDNIWRLDFQLGRNVDREACVRPENVAPFVHGMLGADVRFEPVWYSIYTFQCRRMARFVHGRVIFAGDSAHLVSPFGARGCNGGIADADNLGWKLDRVIRRAAPPALLDSYNDEAIVAADANILASTQSTGFIAPPNVASRALRDAVLQLAGRYTSFRPLVNSGRLSTAVSYPDSSLNTPDEDSDWAGVPPGTVVIDGPLEGTWLLERLGGAFKLLTCSVHVFGFECIDLSGSRALRERLDLRPGSAILVRPDQVVAGRWRTPTKSKVIAAVRKASALLDRDGCD